MTIPWDVIGSVVGGGGFVQLLNWLSDKSKSRAYTMGAVDHAVETALKSTANEITRLNGEIASLREEHEVCKKAMAEFEKERVRLNNEINTLMKDKQPAAYIIGGKNAVE